MLAAVIIALLAGLVFLLLVALVLQRRNCRRLRLQIGQLETRGQETEQPTERFAEDLLLAERKIQEPLPTPEQGMPDRYRYIREMARQGMNAAQIAKILQVGEEEAEQIVRLARLKRDV